MRALLHERVPPHVTRRPNAESERAVEEDEEQRDREQEFRADEHERYKGEHVIHIEHVGLPLQVVKCAAQCVARRCAGRERRSAPSAWLDV